MNGNRDLNGHGSSSKQSVKNASPSMKKVVTIVSPKEMKEDELVSITPNERNWRGICIALLVIVAVLALILFFIVLLSPPYEGPFNPGIKFTIDHVTGNEFKITSFNGTWISANEFFFRDPAGGVSVFNAKDNSVRVLINNSTFRISNGVDFAVSADMKYVLITRDVKKIHTHTKKAKYRIQDVSSPSHVSLTPYLTKSSHHDAVFIQEVIWVPRDSAIVFVYKNNIYYKPEATSNSVVYQITYTGSEFVYNGVPDWLYQEEIIQTRKCMWISPDGRYLAFATFNDSAVGEFKYPVFKTNHQYPEIFSLSYPKVGTPNPDVTISVTDLLEIKNGTYTSINKPKILLNNETYLINVVWDKMNQFAVIWMNREQTVSVISICTIPYWHCQDVHIVDLSVDSGNWVEPSPDLFFSANGTGFITTISIPDGTEQYPQICYVDITTKIRTPITQGQFVVTHIRAWDHYSKVIYFEAAPEGQPTQRHVYNVSDSLTGTNKWHCLTCPVTDIYNNSNVTTHNMNVKLPLNDLRNYKTDNRTSLWPVRSDACRFVRSYFHPFYQPIRYYILECLGPDIPKTLVIDVATNTPTCLLNNRSELAAKYASMAKPQTKIVQVELESGYRAQVKLLIPPVHRERLEMEFPFILYVDTTPGKQGVTEEWIIDWNTYLVSSLNFVVGIVDGRGSSCQSNEMKYEIYKKIGIVDVEDQMAVLLYLQENFKYIDKTRTGVWGRGYGGYITGRLLEQDNGTLFQCGIAVAPVTSWAYYVSVWTERFMGTANVTDNYRGYEEADLTKKVAHFKNKKLLLIHGTADKLVHYQHSMLLVHSFAKHGILFRHLTYPDEDHNFAASSHHVIQAMETFWTDCFGPIEYEDYDEGLSFLAFAR